MNDNIVSASGKAFQKFISHLTQQLTRPKKPLYLVAYRTSGYSQPVILLTDMVVEDFEMALQIRNRFTRR